MGNRAPLAVRPLVNRRRTTTDIVRFGRQAMAATGPLAERSAALTSLARVHRGEERWLGVVRFGPDGPPLEVLRPFCEHQTVRWLTLGVSVGALLDLPPGSALLKALLQLFEEYDFYCQPAAIQSVRSLAARYGQSWRASSAALAAAAGGAAGARARRPAEPDGPLEAGGGCGAGPLSSAATGGVGGGASPRDEAGALRPALRFSAQSGAIAYERLLPAQGWAGGAAGGPLDHSATLAALCEVLCSLYAKLAAVDPRAPSHALAGALQRIDAHVQAAVLAPAARELQAAAAAVLAGQLRGVDAQLFGPDLAAGLAKSGLSGLGGEES